MPAGRRLKVACLTHHLSRYKVVANAMAAGIRAFGDEAEVLQADQGAPKGFDVGVMYGWKRREQLKRFEQFVYADLGYWCRDTHYRLTVGGWGPERYVHAGLPADRLASFGVDVKPWGAAGVDVLLIGAQDKSMQQHGFRYMEWERAMARELLKRGCRVVYRPKPTDPQRVPMHVDGVLYDDGPLHRALDGAACVVMHHSNTALDALAHGVPVYCEIGVGAAFSVALDEIKNPPLRQGREQFLADAAWLQWSVAEMKSGAAWAHLRERNLIS